MSTPAQVARRLGQVASFADAPEGVLEVLAAGLAVRSWAAGEKLAAAGHDAPGLVVVLSGEVELVAPVTDTRGVRLATGSVGTLVGVGALVDHGATTAWATASSAVTALRAEASQFERWFHADDLVGSAVRVACIRDLADQVTNANATLSMIALLKR
jgi:CRP-like cAMP-binding protein